MKKTGTLVSSLLLVLVSMLFLIGLTACKNEPTLEVSFTNVNLTVGETKEIKPTISDTNEIVEYNVDKLTVVTVDNGTINAVGAGDAIITVSLKNYPNVKKTITVHVSAILNITGEDTVTVDSSITLVGTDENGSHDLLWESSNILIATVSSGVVTGVNGGVVTIKATSKATGLFVEKQVNVIIPEPTSVEVNTNISNIKTLMNFKLNYTVLPQGASQEVVWSSSDETIATVDQLGNVTAVGFGQVDIIVTTKTDSSISGKITLNIELDPIAIIKSLNVENPIAKTVTTFGNTTKQEFVLGSVSKYWPGDLNLEVKIIPITPTINGAANPYIGQTATKAILDAAEFKTVRSGIIKPAISNIIYHDTGNNNYGADATMHANYIVGDANFTTYKARSWHYTVDDSKAIQHLPDNEVAWQGDTFEAYTTTIGIETCVDEGSDLYTTWHRTAKLMASILVNHDLKVSDVKQHWDYSRKECPQTLRKSSLYANAVDLIDAEYKVLTLLNGYTITFTSNSPEYVDNYGRILKLDATSKRISYKVTVTNGQGYNQSTLLISTLPAKTN